MIRFQNVTFSYAGYAGEETAEQRQQHRSDDSSRADGFADRAFWLREIDAAAVAQQTLPAFL